MKIHKLGRKETYDDLAGLDEEEEEEPIKSRKKPKKKERKPKMPSRHKKRGMK